VRSRFVFAALAATLLAAPRPARANMAKAVLDGERYGAIVPDGATAVRVDGESLSFVLAPGLTTATVTASYRLTNGGAAAESADVAFVFTRGEGASDDPGARATLEADGAPLEVRAVSDADLLAPRLQAWLEAHPEVDRALRAHDGEASLPGLVAAAGGRCSDGCAALVAWYRATADPEQDRLPAALEDETLVRAAHEAIPAAAGEVARGWSTLADLRLGFLLFHLDFRPGQTRAVTVRYVQRAGVDRQAYVNETYSFTYLLSPARRWAGFGPLDVSIQVPGRALFSSGAPFRREGGTYRAALPALPEGELGFAVTSLDGLWLGMTRPGGYWAILAAAMAAAAIAVGHAAGRVWAGATRWTRVLLPLLTAGPLAAVCSFAVLVLVLWAFPPQALGFGYDALLGGALLIVLAAPVGAVASAVTAARRARRSAVRR
jgi:hypothetical protein